MAHGFQARLDEMLQSRRLQLQRLNEETELQGRKRSQLQERTAALRKVQQRVLFLKQEICRVTLSIALMEDEIRDKQTMSDALVIHLREAKHESSLLDDGLEKNQAFYKSQRLVIEDFAQETESFVAAALEERKALQDSVYEMEFVLKALQDEGAALTQKQQDLLSKKQSISREIAANLSTKCAVEKQLQECFGQT